MSFLILSIEMFTLYLYHNNKQIEIMKDIKKKQIVKLFHDEEVTTTQEVSILEKGTWAIISHGGDELSMSVENAKKLHELMGGAFDLTNYEELQNRAFRLECEKVAWRMFRDKVESFLKSKTMFSNNTSEEYANLTKELEKIKLH